MSRPWFWRTPRPPVGEGVEAHYRRLVARKGKQLWTEADVRDLEAKVARLVKGDTR